MSARDHATRRPPVALLGILTAIDAVSIDSYVPALPAIGMSLRADPAAVQGTLAVFLLGVAIGQAVWGPVGDRIGRRRPLLIGLALFVMTSVLAMLAPNLPVLLIARFLQAIGASAGLVLARAVVADSWPEDQAARLFSIMMQILGVTALVSPLIGGGLLLLGSWRSIFAMLAIVGVASLAWTATSLPESLPDSARTRRSQAWWAGYPALFRQPAFLWAVATSAFTMGTMFALLAGSAFIFIRQFGWSTSAFSLLYAASSIGFIGICQLNALLLRRHPSDRIMTAGLAIQLVLALIFFTLVAAGIRPWPVFIALFVGLISVLGLILGNTVAAAMRAAPAQQAGAASALIGVAQFALSAVATPLSSALDDVAFSVASVSAICAGAAWFSARRMRATRSGV